MFRTSFQLSNTPPAPPAQIDTRQLTNISQSCPVCGNPDIQKVSAFVGQGIWTTSGRGTSVGGGHVMGGPNFVMGSVNYNHSTTMTDIAQRLAPPLAPKKMFTSLTGPIVFGFLSLFSLMLVVSSVKSQQAGGAILAAVFCVLFLGLAIYLYLSDKAAQNRYDWEFVLNTRNWNQAMANWDRMYYCPKCDHAHDAGTKQAVPSHSAYTLL